MPGKKVWKDGKKKIIIIKLTEKGRGKVKQKEETFAKEIENVNIVNVEFTSRTSIYAQCGNADFMKMFDSCCYDITSCFPNLFTLLTEMFVSNSAICCVRLRGEGFL